MRFLLKKIISSLLLPLPIAMLLILIGLSCCVLKRSRFLQCTCIFAGLVILICFSVRPISDTLLQGLENQYQPLVAMPKHIQTIVVLGGGNGGKRIYPPNTRLSAASLSRLIEAIRLYHQHPDTTLILSGGRVFGPTSDASAMNHAALALGVERQHLIITAGARDTAGEATKIKDIIGNKPFVLVTSAYHMPRAMTLFNQAGLHPTPAPTQFLTYRSLSNPKTYFPNASTLTLSDIALHEYLGLAYLKLQHVFKTNNRAVKT